MSSRNLYDLRQASSGASMYKILLIAMLILFSGCSINSRDEMWLSKDTAKACIYWVKIKPTTCSETSEHIAGCTYFLKDGNVIIAMPEDTGDYIIAHEFKHAFGYMHNPRRD